LWPEAAAIPALPAQSEGLAHPGLARSEGLCAERLAGTKTATCKARRLRGQLMGEVVDRQANLLDNGTLHGNLLRKLPEHRDDLVGRNAGPGMARKGASERIV
jgi:hypothetical protein